MKNKYFKITILVLILTITIVLSAGCDKKTNLNKLSKNLSVYDINLEYFDDNNINATENLKYVNNTNKQLNEIKFHLWAKAFNEGAKNTPVSKINEASAYPKGIPNYGTFNITKVLVNNNAATYSYGKEDEDILVVSNLELKKGKSLNIYFEFNFKLPYINHRYGYGDNTINLANFYPIACVYENDEWDTSSYHSNGDPFYSDLSNYNVTFTCPNDFVVAHTGALDKTDTLNNNRKKLYMSQICVRDFAIVLSNKFNVIEDNIDGVNVKYYYYKDDNPEYSLNTACLSIATFSNLFGKYPYSTFSVVECNFVHGGMEYPNLVYISDAVENVGDYQNVIIHETAHQWWYGLVGNSAFKYGWLDEGLTEYSTLLFYEQNPSYNVDIEESIKASTNSYVFFVDIYSTYLEDLDTSLNRSIDEYDTEYEYVYMAYVKGMLLFDNLREVVGDKKFFKGLKYYFEENKFTNVTPDTLIDNFSKVCNVNLKSFFDSWINGDVIIQSVD